MRSAALSRAWNVFPGLAVDDRLVAALYEVLAVADQAGVDRVSEHGPDGGGAPAPALAGRYPVGLEAAGDGGHPLARQELGADAADRRHGGLIERELSLVVLVSAQLVAEAGLAADEAAAATAGEAGFHRLALAAAVLHVALAHHGGHHQVLERRGVLDAVDADLGLDRPERDLDQVTSLLAVPAGEAIGVLDDQGRIDQLGVLEGVGELGAPVALVGGDVFLVVGGENLEALLLGPLVGLFQLVGDRSLLVGRRLRGVEDRRLGGLR